MNGEETRERVTYEVRSADVVGTSWVGIDAVLLDGIEIGRRTVEAAACGGPPEHVQIEITSLGWIRLYSEAMDGPEFLSLAEERLSAWADEYATELLRAGVGVPEA